MKKEEITKILSILMAAFPGLEIPEDTIALWEGCLLPLNYESTKQATENFILSPGKKFFPTPGEILEHYDRIESARRKIQRDEERENDLAAYQKLFHDPVESFHEDYKKLSVQLIRDVCSGKIKYNSPEWNKRFEEIYPGVDTRTGALCR